MAAARAAATILPVRVEEQARATDEKETMHGTLTDPLFRPELRERLHRGEQILFRALTASEPQLFQAGNTITPAGAAHDLVYRIRTGWAARVRNIPDGRRQILTIYLAGDLCGIKCTLMARQPDAIECLTPVTANRAPQKEIRRLADQDPDVALRLMYQLAEDDRRLDNWIASLGRGNAEERLATFIIELRARLRGLGLAQRSFSLPLTQQQISDHLGLTVVHVNRILRRFRESGILRLTRQNVFVQDAAKLAEIAAPMLDAPQRTAAHTAEPIAGVPPLEGARPH
jgi:CRP-like cAMP-binding protein